MLHQPPDAVERPFVLEAAIQEFPSELVPPVGPQVTDGIQLGEQVGVLRVALDLDPQWRGAGRMLLSERFDRKDLDAKLIFDSTADRLATTPLNVQVGGPASPVADRKCLVGSE